VRVDELSPLADDDWARKEITLLVSVVTKGKEHDKGCVTNGRSELESRRVFTQVSKQNHTAGAQSQKQQEKEDEAPGRKRRFRETGINRAHGKSLNCSLEVAVFGDFTSEASKRQYIRVWRLVTRYRLRYISDFLPSRRFGVVAS
jgi:hypothetical protein